MKTSFQVRYENSRLVRWLKKNGSCVSKKCKTNLFNFLDVQENSTYPNSIMRFVKKNKYLFLNLSNQTNEVGTVFTVSYCAVVIKLLLYTKLCVPYCILLTANVVNWLIQISSSHESSKHLVRVRAGEKRHRSLKNSFSYHHLT